MAAEAVDWSLLKTPCWKHQREELLHASDPGRALLWQMRTGKSKAIVDTACQLYTHWHIDAVVVFAPNGVHRGWVKRQLPAHHWDSVPYEAFAWSTTLRSSDEQKASFETVLNTDGLAWFCFNLEALFRDDVKHMVARIRRKRRVLLVVDESHEFRRPGSKRSHMARALAKRVPFRRILTGTAVYNSPLHAWSQFEIVEPGALGFHKYSSFEAHHAEYRTERTRAGRGYQVLDRYKNLEQLRERMADWSSLVLREDCEDLPEVLPIRRDVDPTEQQLKVYRDLLKTFVTELDAGREVSIGEKTTRFIKLQQVMSGFVVDEDGITHSIPGENARLEALMLEVAMTPGKTIVWCRFQEDIDRIAARLREDRIGFVEYHGRVSERKKEEAYDRFPVDKSVHVWLGQYQSGGSGLDLSAADTIINYSHTHDNIARAQSQERATQVGGKRVAVVDLVMPGPDESILDTLAQRRDVAEFLQGQGLREILKGMEV